MGKSSDFLWAEQVGKARENVAKNEILKVRHGAKKCHLTTDKWTKSTDKVFVLNQTFTDFDNVFFKTDIMSLE